MARIWYRNQNLSRQTTTSTTYADVVSLSFEPAASTEYYLFWSAIFDSSTTTDNNRHRLRDDIASVNLANPNHRAQNATEKMSVGGIARWTSSASPGTQTFSIEHQSEVSGTTTGTSDAHLIVIKKESGDQYIESTSGSSTTSSTLSDKATLAFTPAQAGSYLILASAEISGLMSSSPFYARGRCLLDVNGVQYFDTVDGYMTLTTPQFGSWAGALVVNLGASPQTLRIRYASSDNSTNVQIRQARILAIRLDSFQTATTDQSIGRQTTTADSPQTSAEINVEAAGAEYLILGAAIFDYSTSFPPVWGNVKINFDGVSRNGYLKRQHASAAPTATTGARSSFVAFGYGGLSKGNRTLSVDWWTTSSGHTAGITDAFIGAFLLDIVNAEVAVPLVSAGTSGLVPAVAVGAAAFVPAATEVVAAFAPLVSGSINLTVPAVDTELAGLAPLLAVDVVIRAGPSLVAVAGWVPLAVIGTVVRVDLTPAVALSAHDPVRAGPLWRAINENQAVWEDRTPAISTWTPVSAA